MLLFLTLEGSRPVRSGEGDCVMDMYIARALDADFGNLK
jgi:hypothetical protein